METLTCRKALDLLTEIVNDKGRDYVHHGPCTYFTDTADNTAAPVCLIGHLFARLGVKPTDLEGHLNDLDLPAINIYFPFFPNPDDPEHNKLLSLLTEAQSLQDHHVPWGQVLDCITFSLDELEGTGGCAPW